jgi:hypothetical protein
MNEPNQDQERIERLLKASRPAKPSAALKARVTTAAEAAWNRGPAEVPWQVPVWRLAVSAAAAGIIIAFGNRLGDFGRPGAQAGVAVAVETANPELEELAETVYGPSRSRLRTRRGKPSAANDATLREKVERIEQILDEMDSNGIQAQPAPSGGRSRLLRYQRCLGSYS